MVASENPLLMEADYSKALSSEWYDKCLEEFWGEWARGFYVKRANWIIAHLKALRVKRIFEVAGAEGYLVGRILKKLPQIDEYYWSEFSLYGVKRVAEWLRSSPKVHVFRFDVDKDDPTMWMRKVDCFISTALDHVKYDREIVAKVPVGAIVVLSLPNSTNLSHVRFARNFKEMEERYGDLITILGKTQFMTHGEPKYILKQSVILVVKKFLRKVHVLQLLQWLSGYKHFMRQETNPFAQKPQGCYVIIGRRK